MLNVAMCDNNKRDLKKINDIIKKNILKDNVHVQCNCFSNGIDLLADIQRGSHYDCVFLDTALPVMSGLDVAREIYEQDKTAMIIFVSSSKNFAFEAFEVEAADYLLKPVTEAALKNTMSRLLKKLLIEHDMLIIRDKQSYIKVFVHTLQYVEVFDHHLFYHIFSSQTIKCRQKLSDAEAELLSRNDFVKPHRSFLVNLNYVSSMDKNALTMENGTIIPIAKANYENVLDAFLNHFNKE